MSLYKLNELSNELELKKKIADIRKTRYDNAVEEYNKKRDDFREGLKRREDFLDSDTSNLSYDQWKTKRDELRNDSQKEKDAKDNALWKSVRLGLKYDRSKARYDYAKEHGIMHTTKRRNSSHPTRNALIGSGLAIGGAYGAKKLYDRYKANKQRKKGFFHNLFHSKR